MSNSEISEISQEVVIVQQTDSDDSSSNNSCVDIENIQLLHENNDDFCLGASATSMRTEMVQQTNKPLASSLTNIGDTVKQKWWGTARGGNRIERFKDKIVQNAKFQNNQKQAVENHIVATLGSANPPSRYRVQARQQLNRVGVQCHKNFGGKVKGEKVFEDAVRKVNSGSRVQWVNENEFEVLKNQTINRICEHTTEKSAHKIKSKNTISGMKEQVGRQIRDQFKMRMAKQATMMFLVAIMATAQSLPTTMEPPATRVGAEIQAFDCQQPGCRATGQPSYANKVMVVEPPLFGAVQGDEFVTFECTPVAVRLRATEQCYEDIPVYRGHGVEQLFVDMHSRRLIASSAVVPCSQLWPVLKTTSTRDGVCLA